MLFTESIRLASVKNTQPNFMKFSELIYSGWITANFQQLLQNYLPFLGFKIYFLFATNIFWVI